MPGPRGDRACIEFLQWALPRLGLRWAGFRKVRRQVCRRVRRRLAELALPDLEAYRAYLDGHPDEWAILDGLTPITISRFYRDREVWADLERDVLPALASTADRVRCWSAGCASGEEPYTLALLWNEAIADRFPDVRLEVLATDVEPAVLERARRAVYAPSSLKELPPAWRERLFTRERELYLLRGEHRRLVTFARHDVRAAAAHGVFDLVLCRNVAFTYLGDEHQRSVLDHLAAALRAGGALVIGLHESLPQPARHFEPLAGSARGLSKDPRTVSHMTQQRLWAPWRLKYVQGERKESGCIFCLAAESGEDEARHVLHRGERCFVMLNAFPYNSGHLMVSPRRHVASIEDLDADELQELMVLTQRSLRALRDAYGPDGFNMGINEGEVAGAGFAGHVHLHVVPRWEADSNFMAVTGDTRVLPQSLEDSYAMLKERFGG